MHVVIPFGECIARPGMPGRPPQLLSDHLLSVARNWVLLSRECYSDEAAAACLKQELLVLGGLLHDAGKARASWQEYILSSSADKRGRVFHSPTGSALFFYVSHVFLSKCVEKGFVTQTEVHSSEVRAFRAGIALDIASHHGELKDLEDEPPWDRGFFQEHLDEIDLSGLFRFLEMNVSIGRLDLSAEGARTYLNGEALDEWNRLSLITIPKIKRELMKSRDRYLEAARRCVKVRTSGLILADRFDAGRLERSFLSSDMAEAAISKVNLYLNEKASRALLGGASEDIVATRREAQEYAVAKYLEYPDEGIYRLNLPTGMGKTMASLKVALNACAHGITERIVYVAPYISILSQATDEIRKSTGLDVIQHHHLSSLGSYGSNDDSQEQHDRLRSDGHVDLVEDDYLLTMESWQAPVVTTTFNQFFLALFPKRAQQTLRISALRNAFIVIDEAQIIGANAWKLFLHMVEAVVEEMGAQVLFITATMPPVENGLSKPPFSLTYDQVRVRPRYVVESEKEVFDVARLVEALIESIAEGDNVAVVMNTINGAAKVFSTLQKQLTEMQMADHVQIYHLSGAMTPLHKSYVIDLVRSVLESNARVPSSSSGFRPVVVVSTQVLEAGVDLSFDRVYRELPVLPSIIQVAGRANRHGEKSDPSQVRVFRFVDERGIETRRYVYKSAIWREETDRIVEATSGWGEEDSARLLEMFFLECYSRAPAETFLEWLIEGAAENGKALRSVVPFEEYSKPVDVFVPIEDWVTPLISKAMRSFGADIPDDMYNRYLEPGFVAQMSFLERKRFFAVMQHFTVSVDWRKAMRIADGVSGTSLWRLVDTRYYDLCTGLADITESDFAYFEY